MAKKFDTNPLDPDFPSRVMEKETSVLGVANGQTRQFAEPALTEEQTRKFTGAEEASFFPLHGNEGDQPAGYQTASLQAVEDNPKKSLKIGNISLPENVLTALPYIPFAYVGLIAGIIELIFIPKSEPKVRYHAAQGVAAQCAVWIISAILGTIAWGSDFAGTAAWIFGLVTSIMLIVFAFKAWQGKPIHIETVEGLTDWLEERIKPQN